MQKIKITNPDQSFLILYVADDAFAGTKPPVDTYEQEIILRKLAVKMLNYPAKTFQNETIYLSSLNFPDPAAPQNGKFSCYKKSDGYIKKTDGNAAALRETQMQQTQEQPSQEQNAPSPEFTIVPNVANDAPELREILLLKTILQSLPPGNLDDHLPTEESITKITDDAFDEATQYIKQQIKFSLENSGFYSYQQAELMTETIFTDPLPMLRAICDAYGIHHLPELNDDSLIADEEDLRRLSREVTGSVREIEQMKHVILGNENSYREKYKDCAVEYYVMLDCIACAFYNAAKNYYLHIWETYHNDREQLIAECANFNKIFAGIVNINDNYTLSPVEKSIRYFRMNSLDVLEGELSQLLNMSYHHKQPNAAIDYLEAQFSRMQDNFDKKNPVARNKDAKHTVKFSDKIRGQLRMLEQIKDETKADSLPCASMVTINDHIEKAKVRTQEKAESIHQKRAAAFIGRPKTVSFWQNHKGAIKGLLTGVALAALAVAAIVLFAPLSVVYVAALAAAAAVALIAGCWLIGCTIDKYRTQEKIECSPSETESLLGLQNYEKNYEVPVSGLGHTDIMRSLGRPASASTTAYEAQAMIQPPVSPRSNTTRSTTSIFDGTQGSGINNNNNETVKTDLQATAPKKT